MVYNPFSRLDPPIGSDLVKSVHPFWANGGADGGLFVLPFLHEHRAFAELADWSRSIRITRRLRSKLAPRDGFEPSTNRLTVD